MNGLIARSRDSVVESPGLLLAIVSVIVIDKLVKSCYNIHMANKKQGQLTPAPQWWKHLKDWKRVFWKTERQAQKKDAKERGKE